MSVRVWVLITLAYVMLGIGAVVTTYQLHQQQADIEALTTRLVTAVGVYCEIGLLPDNQEDDKLESVSLAPIPARPEDAVHSPSCKRIVARVQEP
jgi:hypothetical protein